MQKKKIKRDAKIYELMEEAYYLRYRLREISTNIRTLHNQTSEGTSKKDRKKFIMGVSRGRLQGFPFFGLEMRNMRDICVFEMPNSEDK